MTDLIASFVPYIAGAIAIITGILIAWLGGKSKGATEAQAKADVKEAKAEVAQAHAATDKQVETTKAVKDVAQANQSLSDDASRERMRGSKYHSAD